jgi:UDP-4-amino-4,6-dideoxy-N-acetyl-beta-L-altrosamine transaminase
LIPYGHQSIDDDDVAAVVEVLGGDCLTQGPAVDAFEEALCAATAARYAVAFSSGTAALHAAAAAADLVPGDVVATSPLSFAASANCALYVGATPAFVDIDPSTLNLDVARIPAHAHAVVAVHYAGLPVDLRALSRRPRVVIEDAAHAIGARTPDGPIGNCAHSDLCCFSFHPVKAITTGEGGAVTTNSPVLAERLRRFRHHGITATPEHGAWCYDIERLGYNYRLTDIQAALGTTQLKRLDRFIVRRNEIADRYRLLLADMAVQLPPRAPSGYVHAYHLFPVRVAHRRRVYEGLRAAGIGVQVHYVPTYRFSVYTRRGFSAHDYPETERAYEGLLSLPMFPDLTAKQQDHVIDVLGSLLGNDATGRQG